MYREYPLLPDEESDNLLEKLLTDHRMKNAWAAINRRARGEDDAKETWHACEFALARWRGEPKLTPLERTKLFAEIHECAYRLLSLMDRTREFNRYSIVHQIDTDGVNWLLDVLNADIPHVTTGRKVGYTRYAVSHVIPSLKALLLDIGNKAVEYSNDGPVLLKPNSENAEMHYFVRSISTHFRRHYQQPLHEAVANIACVALDRDDIDSDLVRKLVRG